MPLNPRSLVRASRLGSVARQPKAHRIFLSSGGKLPGGARAESPEQAMPIGLYYEAILWQPEPVPKVKPRDAPAVAPPKSPPPPHKTAPGKEPGIGAAGPATTSPPQSPVRPATAQEKARIIFGSQLAGPAERAERLEAMRNRSTLIAGILVPPRPQEPDNCCMSGCVNCVWDRYRDEMEEWASASAAAEQALQAQRSPRPPEAVEAGGATSMDDDGGGSETNWSTDAKMPGQPKIAKDLWDDNLYKNIPVGIREFMKQEKRLKEKHLKEGTLGG
ncbi:oxidoreductase-like protein [Durotheca rogersii]|uniref:oxidoreductase-like protein n=1 Tax=Durotheca rogersii TaxID=419775 RepID=UPI00221F9960|nr:oxidoreductase-like protein [Durotheca rogersii]KAI5856673.1 oxidoreductase-like protein [Durotheca rogersii]